MLLPVFFGSYWGIGPSSDTDTLVGLHAPFEADATRLHNVASLGTWNYMNQPHVRLLS